MISSTAASSAGAGSGRAPAPAGTNPPPGIPRRTTAVPPSRRPGSARRARVASDGSCRIALAPATAVLRCETGTLAGLSVRYVGDGLQLDGTLHGVLVGRRSGAKRTRRRRVPGTAMDRPERLARGRGPAGHECAAQLLPGPRGPAGGDGTGGVLPARRQQSARGRRQSARSRHYSSKSAQRRSERMWRTRERGHWRSDSGL